MSLSAITPLIIVWSGIEAIPRLELFYRTEYGGSKEGKKNINQIRY